MQTLTKDTILQKIKENKDEIRKFGIKKVGLFGSFVRGEQRQGSDVDLLVEFKLGKKNFKNFIGFSEYIEKILGKNVEILTPQSLSPYIAPYVMGEINYVQI